MEGRHRCTGGAGIDALGGTGIGAGGLRTSYLLQSITPNKGLHNVPQGIKSMSASVLFSQKAGYVRA